MQISNAASSPTSTQPVQTGTGATLKATTADTGAAVSTSPASPGQNAVVNISPEGAATLAGDQGSATSSDTTTAANTDTDTTSTNDTSDNSSTDDPGNNADVSTSTTSVSPLKSFTYGSLGLERPDQTQQETNSFYTAGRWLAAGITIGGLISLFV
jgi:hypothetical protein